MPETMNLTDKLFQEEVLKRIKETDWEKGNKAPFVVELDPTAACNLACPGCISEDIIALGNRFTDEQLMRIGQEMIDLGVKAVILIGGGEPLAHRKVGDLINLLGENDVHVGITTNGTFIDRYLDPIAKYSAWTRISMDAATEATFELLRPTKGGRGNLFKKILANFSLLAKVKTGKLGYSYLIQTQADGVGVDNVEEIYPAAKLAKELGCDYFEVKPSYQFREGIDHALMKHERDLMERARVEIDRLEELEDSSFKILKAINLQYSLDGVDKEQPKDYYVCPSAHLRTTITPTGVYVCPYWRGKERMRVGDLLETSLAEMWAGERRKEVMDRLDPSVDCNFHCLRNETNLRVFTIKTDLEEGIDIIPLSEFDRFI